MYAHEIHAHEVPAYKMYANEVHTHEVRAHEVRAVRCMPMMYTVMRCRPATAARLIPEYTPDSSHSCRYYPIGIYESPVVLISINQIMVEMSQNQVVIIGSRNFKSRFCSVHLTLVSDGFGVGLFIEPAGTTLAIPSEEVFDEHMARG